jgi:hypothetical protein
MSKLATRVLERTPKYLGLLNQTVWETEPDVVVREARRINSLRLMPEILKIQAAEELGIGAIFGSLVVRRFAPRSGVDPMAVKVLSDQLAQTFDGEWNRDCTFAMLQLAEISDYGLVSLRVVTTAGVNYLVDGFQGTQNISLLRYHGMGTGTNAEATSDTALQTESTTALTPASTRATGTLTEGASANIFRTVGSNVVNTTVSATEHGIFNQAATGGGTLLDRSVFAAVGLVNGNTFQTTYELTIAAGG